MFPVLFTLGPFTLHTYGLLVATGLFLGIYTAVRLAPRAGFDKEIFWNLGVYVALAGLLGSKLMLIVFNWSYYSQNPGQILSQQTLQAGGSILGGLIAAFLVAAWVLFRAGVSFPAAGDVAAPGIAIGQAVGRLGCFAAGCCWGKTTELPWGVTFTNEYSAKIVGVPLNEALHPTQLYESFLSALIFFTLLWVWKRRQFHGQIFASYLLLYPVVRFGLEFLRNDPRGSFFFGNLLSTPQVMSIALFIVGLLFWWTQRKHRVEAQSKAQP